MEELDELDRLRAASTQGEWKLTLSNSGRYQVSANRLQVCAVWHTGKSPATATGAAIVALHNSYPALRNRILELQSANADLQTAIHEADARVARVEDELKGWRHEREMTLTAFTHVRDGGDPALIGHPAGSQFGDALREMIAALETALAAEREKFAAMLSNRDYWTELYTAERVKRLAVEAELAEGKALVKEALDPLWHKNNGFTDAEDALFTWADKAQEAANG